MKKILISPKQDWITKCEGRLDSKLFEVDYIEIDKVKNLYKYDAILTLYEKDSRYLNNKKNRSPRNFLIPSNELISICEDKKVFYDTLVSHGFNEIAPTVSDDLAFPYILKKKIDEFGSNSFIIEGEEDEKKYEFQIRSDDFFKQEFIIGNEEFTFHFLIVNKKIEYFHTLSFLFKKDKYVRGKQMPAFKTAKITSTESPFVKLFENLLNSIGYEGTGCINYKIKNDKPLVFEINPRVGGSLPLDVNSFLDSYCKNIKPAKRQNFLQKLWHSI